MPSWPTRRLARNEASATVEIPVYRSDGSLGRAEFLIGPASQVVAESADTEWDELIDEPTLMRLQHLTASLQETRALPTDDSTIDKQFPDSVTYDSHVS